MPIEVTILVTTIMIFGRLKHNQTLKELRAEIPGNPVDHQNKAPYTNPEDNLTSKS
jgi:hypothetical protein